MSEPPKITAWMHDGEGRVDIISDTVKEIWLKVKPYMVEHYTIPLFKLSDAMEFNNEK
jgi:hypothetical protein